MNRLTRLIARLAPARQPSPEPFAYDLARAAHYDPARVMEFCAAALEEVNCHPEAAIVRQWLEQERRHAQHS